MDTYINVRKVSLKRQLKSIINNKKKKKIEKNVHTFRIFQKKKINMLVTSYTGFIQPCFNHIPSKITVLH